VFGQRSLDSGTDVTAMGFTSEQHDASGLIYLRYRYYDPSVGQFISVDPLVGMTLDPYGYANGNPLQVVDPLGLFAWDDPDPLGDFLNGLSAGLGLAGGLLTLTGIGGPLGLILMGASMGVSTISMVKNASEGEYGSATLDGISIVLGGGVLGGLSRAARMTNTVRSTANLNPGTVLRADINNAGAGGRSFASAADSAGLGVLTGTQGGVISVC
jgi:RHS repeat-associated protein